MCANYKRTNSFEISGHSAVAVDTERVAIAVGTSIVIVNRSGRSTIDHGRPIKDIAIDQQVVVVDEESITAYTLNGGQIWERSNQESFAVAAPNDGDTYGLLSKDKLEIYNISTGNKKATVDRSRPGDTDDILLATPNGYLYNTWSFATLVDQTGSQLFDRDVGTVIKSIGYYNDIFVVAVQTGKVLGLRSQDGESEFKTELNAIQISPVGRDQIYTKTEDGIHALDKRGRATSKPELNTGNVFQSGDGNVLCEVQDDLIIKHTHKDNKIYISIHTDEVGLSGTVNVEVKNISTEPQEIQLTADLEGCNLAPSQRTCKLNSNESKIIDFPVSNIQTEGEATFTVSSKEGSNDKKTLFVEDAAIGAIGVDPQLNIKSIEHGKAELEIEVVNTGGVVLDEVQLKERDETAERIKPNDSWSTVITRPYEPQRGVTAGIRVTRGDRNREFAPTCSLPPIPTIDLSDNGEVLRCEIKTSTEYELTDRIVVEVPGAGRTRAEVTIEDEILKLLIPQYDDGVARISLETLDVEDHIEVYGSSPFVEPSKSSTETGSDETRNETSNQVNHSADTQPVESQQPDNTHERNQAGEEEIDLKARRQVPEVVPAAGHVITEKLLLTNTGKKLDDVVLEDDGDQVGVGQIKAGDRLEVRRNIIPGTPEDIYLNEINVKNNEETISTIPESILPVVNSNLGIQTRISRTNYSTEVAIHNHTDQRCVIRNQIFETGKYTLNQEILPESSKIISSSIDDTVPNSSNIQRVDYEVEFDTSKTERIKTVGMVVEEDIHAASYNPYENILFSINDRTVAGGEYPEVVVEMENNYSQKIDDVYMGAHGKHIHDKYYTPHSLQNLHENESTEHVISIDTTGSVIEFNLLVKYEMNGRRQEIEFSVSGETVANEDDWSTELLETWSVDFVNKNDENEINMPEIISSEYQVKND